MDNQQAAEAKLQQFLKELDGLCDRYNYLIRPEIRLDNQSTAHAVISVTNRPATVEKLETSVQAETAPVDQVVPSIPQSDPTPPQPDPVLPQPEAPAVDNQPVA